MTAVYKKEIKGLLTSMIGYVFIAFLLVVAGIYFSAYNLQGMYPQFAYTLSGLEFVFLIAVPVLTMRMLAEERKQKTDQLLLTSPVSVGGIIMGKYLALVTVYLIPMAVLALYPLVLSQFGTIYYGETYVAVLGFFLMGSCYLAIGLYLSSVTESQVIAAVITFLFLFVCYVIDGIATFFPETANTSFYVVLILIFVLVYVLYVMAGNILLCTGTGLAAAAAAVVLYVTNASVYEGLIQKLLNVFDMRGHFSEFMSGILDLTSVVYYVTVIGVFLFLSVQSIQKRRWS